MKKITLLAIAALAISFASCKKDRVCTCTSTTTTPAGSTTSPSQATTYTKVSKGAGRANCLSTKSTSTYGGVSVTDETKCTLS